MTSRNLLAPDSETFGYNKDRMRRFFKNLAAIYLRHKKREKAHKDLHMQLNKVKKVSMSKAQKKEVENEIHELKNKINKLLEMKGHETLPVTKEKQNAEVKAKIAALESKLQELIDKKSKREERIEHIEKKIKEKFMENKETKDILAMLREQIIRLTEKYEDLASDKHHDKKKLAELKRRIDKSKHMLRDMETRRIGDTFSR